MIKFCFFRGENELGPTVIPLFNRATDAYFEKVAAPTLQPDVIRFIESLKPRKDAIYNLVNALGAGEFFSSNTNGDFFSEAALMHGPEDWSGNPLLDRIKFKDWQWGYPTFYQASVYQHHRNKDSTKRLGDIEFVTWNPRMKRVELVTRVDKEKCEQFGAIPLWDKLSSGMYLDLSMGAKVKYDLCSICTDWDTYREAEQTFNSKKHKAPDEAILLYHKNVKKIRGLSITRSDYCSDAKSSMNRILSDGRKVWVYNPYPRFFDQSYVFIGADRTSKNMMKLGSATPAFISIPSAQVAEELGYTDGEEKVASVRDPLFTAMFGKVAKRKESEITKDTIPDQLAAKAMPILSKFERDIPRDVLDTLGRSPLESSLSTTGGLGIVLRPKEFQRIILIQVGRKDLADELEDEGVLFPRVEEKADLGLGPSHFMSKLLPLLSSIMRDRSSLTPHVTSRLVISRIEDNEKDDSPPKKEPKKKIASLLHSDLLHKIGAAYEGYREELLDLLAYSSELLSSFPSSNELSKLAMLPVEEVISPLSVQYIKLAFLDEFGILPENQQKKVSTYV